MRLLLLLLALGTAQADIKVYTLTDMVITGNAEYTRIDVDRGDRLMAELGTDLPKNLEAAAIEARRRLGEVESVPLSEEMEQAFGDLLRAFSDGIESVPAIVIDDQYLIYGVEDVDEAIDIYEAKEDESEEEEEPEPLIPDTDQVTWEPPEEADEDATTEVTESTISGDHETIDSSAIFTASADVNCMAWEIVGVCIWVTYYYFGVEVDWSLKVSHHIPDAVVSTYQNTGENPWTDVESYSAPIDGEAEGGGTNKERNFQEQDTALLFKNADVIGSPGTYLFDILHGENSDYFCEPQAEPFYPYFLSTLDFTWRNPLLEFIGLVQNWGRHVDFKEGEVTGGEAQSKLDADFTTVELPNIGLNGSAWGPVYPRHGFINQGHDYKAGAVIAQAAGDIVTRDDQVRVYIPMTEESENQGQWSPPPLVEGDEDTGWWQQLIPADQDDGCIVFADQSDQRASGPDPFFDRLSQKSGYAFNLWRKYWCCGQAGAVLVADFGE